MKKLLFLKILLFGIMVSAQDLPTAVTNSFNKQFPNQVITSWNDNSYYDYENDWRDDIYFGDYDFDGFADPESYGYPYNNGYNYGYYNGYGYPYYGGYSREYVVPVEYVVRTEVNPTYYQLYFTMKDVRMSSIFKPDGTFIIAKGRISSLPNNVTSSVMAKFKGQTIRFGGIEEKIIIPSSTLPIYRFKVEVKHARNHIMKVDANGKVISDNIR